MEKWSESLVQRKVGDEVFETNEDVTQIDQTQLDDMQFLCEGVFTDKERLKKVRGKIKKTYCGKGNSSLVRNVAESVLEQLAEIKDDLKFAKSRRGKFILFVNDWAQQAYVGLRQDTRFDDIMIGSHLEEERIVVTGETSDPATLVETIQMIATNEPGVPVEYRITVQTTR